MAVVDLTIKNKNIEWCWHILDGNQVSKQEANSFLNHVKNKWYVVCVVCTSCTLVRSTIGDVTS